MSHQIYSSSFAYSYTSPNCRAEKSIMMLLPSILSRDSCCHSSPRALPWSELYSLILLMSAQSSLLALNTKPLLISSVLMIFSSLQSSLFPLLKISSLAYSLRQNSRYIAFVFSPFSCYYLQSRVRQEYTLIRISGARSMLRPISQGLRKISERTVYLSCLMVLISENSYSMVVELRRFLSMLTQSLRSRLPLMGYCSFLRRVSVSICRWQLFLSMFCSRRGSMSLTSGGVSSSARVMRVLVLLVRTFTMLWLMFLMMFLRHCLKSNFFPTLATKKPMPRVQLDAIFSLSLSLCRIMQSRHSFSYSSRTARAKMFVFAQLDSPQVILTIELRDLYCLDMASRVRMDLAVMSSLWNYGQKEMQPSSLIRATLIRELFLMALMKGKSAVYESSTKEQKQCRRNCLAQRKVGSVQQSQSMQVRVESNRRQLLTVTSWQQTSRNLRKKRARVSCLMLGSLLREEWEWMACSSSKQPLNISSTNSLQLQLIVPRKLPSSALQMDSSPWIWWKMMLKYFLESLVKQLSISLVSLSCLSFLSCSTSKSLRLMLPLCDLKYFSSISTQRLLLLTSTERKLMHRILSSSSSTMLHSNSRTGMMQLLMSSPMPSSKDILSIRLQLLHSSHSVLKIAMMICRFFSQQSANSRKQRALRSPEKMMNDLGMKEDLVDLSSFSTQARSAAAMSFFPSKLAIMFSRQLIELAFTLLFRQKMDRRMRLWSPKLLRIRFTISLRTSALIFAYQTVSFSCLTWARNSREMTLEVTHIYQQVSVILLQCLKREERRPVALILIFWWAEFIFLSRFSSFDSLSPYSQSEHQDMLENPPCRQAVSKLKFSQLHSFLFPKILSWKVSLPRKHSLKISLMAFQKSTSPTLTIFSPLLASMYFSSSAWQKERNMSSLLRDLMKSRLQICWQMLMQRLFSMLHTILMAYSKNLKCLRASWFSKRTVMASRMIFILPYSILALAWHSLPSYSLMPFSSSSSLRMAVIFLPSLIHSSHCLYLNYCTCIFDLLMFLEVYHIPLFLCLAMSLKALYFSIFSLQRYFYAFLDSQAYPSSIIFSSIMMPSLFLLIYPKMFTSSLQFSEPDTVSSMNSPSSSSLKQNCALSHISLGCILAMRMSLSYEKQKVTNLRLLRLMRSSLRHQTLLTKHCKTLLGLTSLLIYSLLSEFVQKEVISLPSRKIAPFRYSSLILLLFFSRQYYRVLPAMMGRRCWQFLLLVGLTSTLRSALECWSWSRKWKGEKSLSTRPVVGSSMLCGQFKKDGLLKNRLRSIPASIVYILINHFLGKDTLSIVLFIFDFRISARRVYSSLYLRDSVSSEQHRSASSLLLRSPSPSTSFRLTLRSRMEPCS